MDQRPKPRIWNGDNVYDSDEEDDDDEKNQSVLTFASGAVDAHMR